MDIKLYIGQYKKPSRILKFNKVRYTTICLVLDYFCYMNSIQNDVARTQKSLIDQVFKQSSFRRNEFNETVVGTTITNMIMMGLLLSADGYVAISDLGKQAYIEQTYHKCAADLYEASESRKLSKIAVIIAVISLLITSYSFIKSILPV